MIVLENADILEGDSTNASEVDYVISGLDNSALKQLADGQLANSKGTIFTADSTDVVTAITLTNTGAAHNHVNLYFKPTGGTSRRIIPKDLQLEVGYSLYFEGGKCVVMTTGGAIAYTIDTAAFLDDTAGGTDALTTKAPTSNAMYDGLLTKVPNSLYDAHSILAATSDDTPAAITVSEQQVVGRITSGNIKALSITEMLTLLFTASLIENISINLEETLSADGKYTGITLPGVAGATLAFGDLVYLAAADGRWEKSDANVEAGSIGLLGMVVLAAAADGDATKLLLIGTLRADTAFADFSSDKGEPLFISETPGAITVTRPTTASCFNRIVGHVLDGNSIVFNPSAFWIKLVA